MSGERIKAGEAYVLVTCDNNNLKNGLQEVVRSVDEAAREISAKEKELSPTIKIDPEPVKKAIDEALAKAREVANAGSNFWDWFIITAGDAVKAVGNALKIISSALGENGSRKGENLRDNGHDSGVCESNGHISANVVAEEVLPSHEFHLVEFTLFGL